MIILVAKSDSQLPDGDRIGTLVTPRNGAIPGTRPWAADNEAFTGFDAAKFKRMVARLGSYPGCLWVAVPDVVADDRATRRRWRQWRRFIDRAGLPAAFVGQDGATDLPFDADALFLGGSTEWKLSDDARRLVDLAHSRDLWTHMGRVNTHRRARLAYAWGIHSIDGTAFAMFTDVKLPGILDATRHRQLALP